MVKIFLDLEMNPVAKGHHFDRDLFRSEIIQIGAVALDSQDCLIGKYEQIVKPEFSNGVTPAIYRLTGITTEMLDHGICFKDAINGFADWCTQISNNAQYEIYAWSDNDLIQLQKEMIIKELNDFLDMPFMNNGWIDFQYIFCDLLGISSVMSLDKAIKALDMDFKGNQHNALSDALNTAKLYQMVQNKEEFDRLMKPIKDMMAPSESLSTQMGSVFDLSMFNFDEE